MSAQAILDSIPEGARPQRAPLPSGVEVGHRYSYRAPGRMGTVFAQPGGLASKAKGGLPVTAPAGASFTHATVDCPGCSS